MPEQQDTFIDELTTPQETVIPQFEPEKELSAQNWEDIQDGAKIDMNLSGDYWKAAIIPISAIETSMIHYMYLLSPSRALRHAPLGTDQQRYLQQQLNHFSEDSYQFSRDAAFLALLLQMQGGMQFDLTQLANNYNNVAKQPHYKDQRIEFLASVKICNPDKETQPQSQITWEEVKDDAQKMLDKGKLINILWIQIAFPGKIRELKGFGSLLAEKKRVFNAFKDDPARFAEGIAYNAVFAALLTCGGVDLTPQGLTLLPYEPPVTSQIPPHPEDFV